MQDGAVTIGINMDTKGFEEQIKAVEDELETLAEEYELLEKSQPFEGKDEQLRKMRVQAEKLSNKLGDLKEKQKDLENTNVSNFGVSLEKLTKKVTHFGLALIGVGSIYGLVRKAARSYLAEHEQTAEIFGDMWKNLMAQLEPYIEKVINWLLRLLAYVNVFLKAISGGKIDLTKKMNNNAKSIEKTGKATKELNKQMAQFDEATKLSDNRSLDSGVGISGSDISSIDQLNNIDLNPKWVEKLEWLANKIKENWPTIKKMALEIGAIFAVAKVGEWLLNINSLLGVGGAVKTGAGGSGLVGLAVALLAVAAALSVLAAAKTWQDVIDNYKKLRAELEGRGTEGEASKKIGETVKDALVNPQNYTPEQVGLAKKSSRSQVELATDQIKGHAKTLKDWTKGYNIVVAGGDAVISSLRGQTNMIDMEENSISGLSDKVLSYIDAENKAIENGNRSEQEIAEYIEWLKTQRTALKQSRDMLDENSKAYRIIDGTIDQVRQTINKYDTATTQSTTNFENSVNSMKKSNKELADSIDGPIGKILQWNNTKMENKTASVTIASTITATTQSLADLGKNFANALILGMQAKLAMTNASNSVVTAFKDAFKLASGGIINLPGRGVPLTYNAIGGEGGAEGVIPLTDSQAMETLGEAIGRYVTINANITNTMNGRVISRELQKINNESTFMGNR